MATINIGFGKFEIGDIASDGGPGTSLASPGNTYRDSANFEQEEAETHDFEVEEQDTPIASIITKPGTMKITWEVVDFDVSVMQKLFGGTTSGGAWNHPDRLPEVEQTVKFTPKQGKPFLFPRCKLTSSFVYDMKRTGIARIKIEAKVLKPTKAGVAPFVWGE